MPIFNDTFRPHILEELTSRKNHWHRQEVTIPNVRVTSLVRTGGGYVGGNIRLGQIHGFTLGVPDVSQVNTVNQLHNLDEQGSIIGITYLGPNNNEPKPVRIPTKKNLPAPGITGVTISTQSKGGLTFKATVNFKMYGKEQYDAIYQLLFRPGNPVVIEYGHTRTEETLKDLNFFEDLNEENLGRFKKDIIQQSRLPSTRTTGTLCGLVSNFKIRLNQNNEYEASMDIINALEVMYSLPIENTLMSYSDLAQAASIKSNFGHIDVNQYNEMYDRVFQYIIRDNGVDPEYDWTKPFGTQYNVNKSENMILLGSINRYEEADEDFQNITDDLQTVPGFVVGGATQALPRAAYNLIKRGAAFKTLPTQNEMYVDFEYFMNDVLDKVLYESVTTDDRGCLRSIIKTPAEIATTTETIETTSTTNTGAGPINTSTSSRERVTGRSRREAAEGSLRAWLNGVGRNQAQGRKNIVVEFEKMKYWPQLRSTNIKNVIINNASLYSDDQFPGTPNRQVYAKINEIYMKRFGSPSTNNPQVAGSQIPYNISWQVYFNSNKFIRKNKKYSEQTPWSGIFVNYKSIRDAFMESQSVAEAIVKILNEINTSTGGVFNLKLKHISEDYITEPDRIKGISTKLERHNLTIYDEKNPPNPKDYKDVYTFFENDTSEAISYNFDFSLPQAVSSTVLANNFARNNPDVVGEAETYQLIYNGQEDHITKLIDDFLDRDGNKCGNQDSFLGITQDPNIRYSLFTGGLVDAAVSGSQFIADFLVAESRDIWDRIDRLVRAESEQQQERRRLEKRATDALGEEMEEYLNFTAYIDFFPEVTKSQIIRSGLLSTFPSSAKVSIKLLGIDGFRFGDLFRVKNMLPHPYDEYNIFMLTGYKHTINDKGWFTDIDGIMIAGTPPEKDPKNLPEVEAPSEEVAYGSNLDLGFSRPTSQPRNYVQLNGGIETEITPDQVSIGTDVSSMEMRLRGFSMIPSGNN